MLVALVAAIAVTWLILPVPQAGAQGPTGQVQVQLVNGTKDAKAPNTGSLPITLYIADMNAQNVITQTGVSDAKGSATFSNLKCYYIK